MYVRDNFSLTQMLHWIGCRSTQSPPDSINLLEAPLPGDWPEWPGGWPGKVEAALIDAVLSIRATYGQSHNGVRGAIQRWQAARDGGALDDLTVLASCAPPSC